MQPQVITDINDWPAVVTLTGTDADPSNEVTATLTSPDFDYSTKLPPTHYLRWPLDLHGPATHLMPCEITWSTTADENGHWSLVVPVTYRPPEDIGVLENRDGVDPSPFIAVWVGVIGGIPGANPDFLSYEMTLSPAVEDIETGIVISRPTS